MNCDVSAARRPNILVINPGSTSTKVAVFAGNLPVYSQTLQHSSSEFAKCGRLVDQLPARKEAIDRFLSMHGLTFKSVMAVAGRGGLLRPLKSGTYIVSDKMCQDLQAARYGEHASNLGALLARQYADSNGIRAFVVDPVTLDEFDEASRPSGVPGIERKSRIHALNIRAVARAYARDAGKDLSKSRLVIAHMGGGISVCAMAEGRIIDSTDALLGEGPFSLERAGTLPLAAMIELCFDSSLSKPDVKALLSRNSGFKGLAGLDRLPEIYEVMDGGNRDANRLLEAMIRQIAKWIGAMAAVIRRQPDAIILTGGMANSSRFTESIASYVSHLGPVKVYPGEHEMEALAEGVLRVLNKEEPALDY